MLARISPRLTKRQDQRAPFDWSRAQVLSERFGDNGELVTAESSARIA